MAVQVTVRVVDRATSEFNRQLQNVVRLGTVAEVDHARALVRVDIDGRLTDWRPIPGEVGANFTRWRPLRVGTQVLVSAPSGDPANAVIVQTLYSETLPPPDYRGDVDLAKFDDGTSVWHDSTTHELTISSAGDLSLRAGGTIWIDATHVSVFERP